MLVTEDAYLEHYGILRRSGRYPWGSGGNVESRSRGLSSYIQEMLENGLTEVQIAEGVGMTTTQLRAARAIAKAELKAANIAMAQRMKDKGMSNVAIGERMGLNESSVRALLAPGAADRSDTLTATSNMMKDQVDSKGLIDIGAGVETYAGVSRTQLDTSIAMLKEQGYEVHYVKVEQLGTGHQTTLKVLAPPGMSYSEVYAKRREIQQISEFSEDGGRTFKALQKPMDISSDRVGIRYAEDGGTDADGVMYIRRGVDDVSIGNSRYAQVRVSVDGTHYLKGMAVYRDDLPEGVDILFNTNKSSTGNKLDALKKQTDDPNNPFGASISRQLLDSKGKPFSAMNIVNEEGGWDTWSRSLSSQMLSKQSPQLARTQLDMTYQRRKDELDDILTLTNPAVKKTLLEAYSDSVDSAAVHLKAAALPRQASHVILPLNKLKETEVYAPNYRDGERVTLVRYPHGGIFEIPELTVNNKHAEGRSVLGNAKDAIGINSKVAERLSGADFDGDTVVVIPNNHGRIKTAPALEGLKNFDPQRAYPGYEGMKPMSAKTKQKEMGVVSNLITDMTILGANPGEIARAVRHSMVVIDAEKHKLNYKQSAKDNGISQLKKKYQGSSSGGAATLISRASSPLRVPERKSRAAAQGGPIDRDTGRKIYRETGASYIDKETGKTVPRTHKVKRLSVTDDAFSLSSGTPIEKVYATHSNKLKDLGNQARKASVSVKPQKYSPTAKKTYSKEVERLNAALHIAQRNRPRERQAQIIANAAVSERTRANPPADYATLKKIRAQELNKARSRTGAKKTLIEISDKEWEAIQAGAISNSKLEAILSNADLDRVKELATPKTRKLMTPTKLSRAKAMFASGYTQAEVADALGVSLTTLKTAVYE